MASLHFESFTDSILEFNVAQEFKQRSNLNYFAVEVSDDTVRRKNGETNTIDFKTVNELC